jgi:tetratricopeptide (TPR) repeat protein
MNNKPRVVLLGVLAIVALSAGIHFAYDAFKGRQAAEAIATAAAAARAKAEQYRAQARAEREARAQVVRSLKDPGPSHWLQQRLAPLSSALVKSNARTLILPPSNPEDKPGLDLTARIAFARALTDALAAENAALVPDPGFALAAIGEPRTIDETSLLKLLAQTSIESLVTGTLSLEPGRVVLLLHRTTVQTKQRRTHEAKLEVSADRPEHSLSGVASEAMHALGFETTRREKEAIKASPALALPASPLAAISQPADPLTGIWLQQLFGVLHSPLFLAEPRAQERMFERSLWSLSEMGNASADRAVLEARALSYLGRREAALRALEDAPSSPESAALRAYLNADLQALEKAVGNIRRPVARLIGELELLPVREAAGSMTRESRTAALQRIVRTLPEPWHALVGLYGLSFDAWSYPSPVVVKGVLERDFPVPDYRAQEVILGKAALGANPFDPKIEAELALSPLVHVRKWREQHIEQLCCARPAARGHRPALTDYLDLLENSAEALMLGHLYFLREVQGNRDQALATINLYDELLFARSHPGLLMQKGSAFIRTGRQPPTSWDNGEVFEAARKIKAWTGHQSQIAAWAAYQWQRSVSEIALARGYRGPQNDDLLQPPDKQPLAGDSPARDVFLADLASGLSDPGSDRRIKKEALRTACAIAVHYFWPCHAYAQLVGAHGQEEERKQAEVLLRGRFAGYADAARVKVSYMREQGRTAEAKALLRDALNSSPSQGLYADLGDLLSEEGEFDEAAKVYGALPQLKTTPENTVRLSNYLHAAANHLLVRGAAAQARRFFETAASYRDGSQANLQAGIQVALWQNDGEHALQRMRALYQRYPNPRTLGHIASLMFALGDKNAAWSVVKSGTTMPDFPPFAAAVVGLRRDSAGVPEMLAWVESSGAKTYLWTATTAFRIFAVDRKPETIDNFNGAERPLRLKDPDAYSHGFVSGKMGTMTAEDDAAALRATVDGYRDWLRGNHLAAVEALSPLFERFDKTGAPEGFQGPANFWSMLPYMAYSLAKTGRQAEAAKLLERFDEHYQRTGGRQNVMVKKAPAFESHLVNAIVAAMAGNHAKGLRELRLAQANMPSGQTRLVPEAYAFAELAELLGRDTGNPAYVGVAVDFARAHQVFEPWTAWSYAFEAAHGKDQASRVRAAGISLWLDPDSRRLQGLPAALKSSGKQWLQRNPPFRNPAAAKREAKA